MEGLPACLPARRALRCDAPADSPTSHVRLPVHGQHECGQDRGSCSCRPTAWCCGSGGNAWQGAAHCTRTYERTHATYDLRPASHLCNPKLGPAASPGSCTSSRRSRAARWAPPWRRARITSPASSAATLDASVCRCWSTMCTPTDLRRGRGRLAVGSWRSVSDWRLIVQLVEWAGGAGLMQSVNDPSCVGALCSCEAAHSMPGASKAAGISVCTGGLGGGWACAALRCGWVDGPSMPASARAGDGAAGLTSRPSGLRVTEPRPARLS